MLVCADVGSLGRVNAALNDPTVAALLRQLLTTAGQAQSTLLAMNTTLTKLAGHQTTAVLTPIWPSGQGSGPSSVSQYGLSSVGAVAT